MFFKKKIKFGETYGVIDGSYTGHTLMFVKKHGDVYGFCDIYDGKMDARWISKKDFDFGVKNGILELVDPQPSTAEKNDIKKIAENKFDSKKE
jgi:hypothetical protein